MVLLYPHQINLLNSATKDHGAHVCAEQTSSKAGALHNIQTFSTKSHEVFPGGGWVQQQAKWVQIKQEAYEIHFNDMIYLAPTATRSRWKKTLLKLHSKCRGNIFKHLNLKPLILSESTELSLTMNFIYFSRVSAHANHALSWLNVDKNWLEAWGRAESCFHYVCLKLSFTASAIIQV